MLLVMVLKSIVAARRLGLSNSSFWFFAVLVLLTNLSGVVSQFNGGRTESLTTIGQSVVTMPASATFAASLVVPGLMLGSFFYMFRQGTRNMRINAGAFCYFMVLVFAGMGSLNAGFPFLEGSKFALFATALALIFAPRNLNGLVGAAHALGILVALSAILALFDPKTVAEVCGERKCGLLGSLYNGIYFNFNGFGLLMAVAVPVLYFGMIRYRGAFVFAAVFMTGASGSRTSQIAAALVFLLIILFEYSRHRARRVVIFLSVASAVGAVGATIALPLIGLPGDSFTGRVNLWNDALGRLRESPLVGFGPDSWASLQQIGLITRASAYATHNQFVETLYVSGTLGLIAMTGVFVAVVHANRGYLGQLAILLFPVLMIAATERPWSLGPPDWLSWSLLLTVCTSFAGWEDLSGSLKRSKCSLRAKPALTTQALPWLNQTFKA